MILVLAKALPKDDASKEKITEYAENLINNSRKEKGNMDYNLFDNVTEGYMLFVEQWESKEILDKHLKTDHFIRFGENIEELIKEELTIDIYDAEPTEI